MGPPGPDGPSRFLPPAERVRRRPRDVLHLQRVPRVLGAHRWALERARASLSLVPVRHGRVYSERSAVRDARHVSGGWRGVQGRTGGDARHQLGASLVRRRQQGGTDRGVWRRRESQESVFVYCYAVRFLYIGEMHCGVRGAGDLEWRGWLWVDFLVDFSVVYTN